MSAAVSWRQNVLLYLHSMLLCADHSQLPAGEVDQHATHGLQDEQEFEMGAGVEEALEVLADGGKLPPDPRLAGKVPESAESFRERMRKMTARFEAQFLKRKDWEVRPCGQGPGWDTTLHHGQAAH